MQKKYAANIWKLNIFQGIHWFLVFMPILVLFYQEKGLSMTQIMIIQTAYSVMMVTLEIPSGYFSDVLGRRKTLILGAALGFIGAAVYSFSTGFWGFFIAEIILGAGNSFISGTGSALLYDTLICLNKEGEYKKREGLFSGVAHFSEAGAAVLGGFLAFISLHLTFHIRALIMLPAIPLAMSLVEPVVCVSKGGRIGSIGHFLKIIKDTFKNPPLRYLICYSSLIAVTTFMVVWLIQPYLKQIGIPVFLFGIIWSILNASVGFFSLISHKVEDKIGRNRMFVLFLITALAGYILLGTTSFMWSFLFLFIFYFQRGVSSPLFKHYINKEITSDRRATVLSLRSMVIRLIFCVTSPFIGFLTDEFSLQTGLVATGIIYVLPAAGLLFLLLRAERRVFEKKKDKNKPPVH